MDNNNNINNNNIDNENTEKATFMSSVKNFVKDHKIPTVITALVLVWAIGTGVVFGVTRHSSNIGEFPTFSSDETGSDIDIPAIEDDEDTSSETDSTDSEYTASTVITQTSTPDKSTSSTVSIEQPSTSTPEYPTTSGTTSTTTPTTSTPSTPSETPSTPSTTPFTPSPSTPSDTSSDSSNDDLAGVTWEWMTSTNGTQFRGGYVTIGQRTYLVDYDAIYGVCNKCGLNTLGVVHRDRSCPLCGATGCSKIFYYNDNKRICPYCLGEFDTFVYN